MRNHFLFAGLACALSSTQASPQCGLPTGLRIPVETVTTNLGCLGVARTNYNGEERFWVTARALVLANGQPHLLYEFDRAGTLKATYNQPPVMVYGATNTWGIRDLAYDGRYLFGGAENAATGNKVFAFDVAAKVWDGTKDVTLVAPAWTVTRALTYSTALMAVVRPA